MLHKSSFMYLFLIACLGAVLLSGCNHEGKKSDGENHRFIYMGILQ